MTVPLTRRVHPHRDHDAHQRGNRADQGRPDYDREPLARVLPDRCEVEPVRDRTKVGPEPRRGGGVLHHVGGDAADVGLLAVGPRVLVERALAAARPTHRPLIDLFDQGLVGFASWSARPLRGRAIDHGIVHIADFSAIVGEDARACTTAAAGSALASPAAPAKAIDGTPVKTRQTHLRRSAVASQRRECALSRDSDALGQQHRRSLQSIGRADAGKAPVHHHDAGDEPEQEHERQRDAQPPVDEDERPLQQRGRSERHVAESTQSSRHPNLKTS